MKDNSKLEGPAPESPDCSSQHLPCGCEWEPCEEDPHGPIFWNRFNGVAQCHMCGQVYTVPATAAPSQPAAVDLVERYWKEGCQCGNELCDLCNLAEKLLRREGRL